MRLNLRMIGCGGRIRTSDLRVRNSKYSENPVDTQEESAWPEQPPFGILSEELSTKKDLAETEARIVKWVAMMLVTQAGVIAALVKLL